MVLGPDPVQLGVVLRFQVIRHHLGKGKRNQVEKRDWVLEKGAPRPSSSRGRPAAPICRSLFDGLGDTPCRGEESSPRDSCPGASSNFHRCSCRRATRCSCSISNPVRRLLRPKSQIHSFLLTLNLPFLKFSFPNFLLHKLTYRTHFTIAQNSVL